MPPLLCRVNKPVEKPDKSCRSDPLQDTLDPEQDWRYRRHMSRPPGKKRGNETGATPSDRYHAIKRRARRDASKQGQRREKPDTEDRLLLFGLHTVRAALSNPRRRKHMLYATKNALARLEADGGTIDSVPIEIREPRSLDRLAGPEAVHQGLVLDVSPLPSRQLRDLGAEPLLLVLDQVTDPHNVGAILRSAVACGAGAVIATRRHSATETATLAKSASGALDMIDLITVGNLATALGEIRDRGYRIIGLEGAAQDRLEDAFEGDRLALVLGAEGRGLRARTRECCDVLARIALSGSLQSLNVSNAAAISLYLAQRHIGARSEYPGHSA
jgi:23S rRNA (guanosine2251-2'-O)-methyltransferase